MIGVSSADGTTPVTVYVDPTTHRVLTQSSGSTNPGGADTQVQFNDGGTLSGEAGLTYNKTTDTLTAAGDVKCDRVGMEDSDSSHYLYIDPGSNLTADHTLTVTTGDADRTLTVSGNATISQDYSSTGNPQFATVELGHATDTTLSRSSAGVLAVEGVTVSMNSTSATHTAGTIELGNASDTTLSRSAAGVLAVEGVDVATISGTQTLTNKTVNLSNNTLSGTTAQFNTALSDGDFATLAGSETLTNKTLTAPKIADGGFIADANGNELIKGTTTASAVNEITVANAATGTAPVISATGGDANIDLKLDPKGSGKIVTDASVNFGAFTAYFTETDNGNSSTADTIDWTLSNKQKSTLTGNCTFTFTAPPGPCNLTLKLVQDATGSRLVTWPAAVKWSGGTPPTLTTTASRIDIISFYYDGTNYYGASVLNFTA